MGSAAFHLTQALIWSAAATLLVLAILSIGTVAWLAACALGFRLRPSLAVIYGTGLFELVLFTWYAWILGHSFADSFAWILFANLVAAVLALSLARRRCLGALAEGAAMLRSRWPLALIFLAAALVLAGLITRPLDAGHLRLVTIGNNDIFNYVKLADFALHRPGGMGNIVGSDLAAAVSEDVFGTVVFHALASFLLRQDTVATTIAPLVAAGALIATAVAWICNSVLRLPWLAAAGFGLLAITTEPLIYSALHYYLSQFVGAALLVVMTGALMAPAGTTRVEWRTIIVGIVFLGSMLFAYQVMLLPALLLFAALVGWRSLPASPAGIAGRSWLWCIAAAAGAAVLATAAVAAGILALAPTRVAAILAKLPIFALTDLAGVKLGLISPAALIGLPVPMVAGDLNTRAWLELALCLAIAGAAAVMVLTMPTGSMQKLQRLTPLAIGAGLLLVYLLVWAGYGASYQQWKFAASYTVLFGFALLATLAAGMQARLPAYMRGIGMGMAATLVLIFAGLNVRQAAQAWLPHVKRLPSAYAAIAMVDRQPEITELFVDLPDFTSRMLAAGLIREKRVRFLGPTYYGSGAEPPATITAATPILREAGECDDPQAIPLGERFVLSTLPSPPLPVNSRIAFTRTTACIHTTGVSVKERWGRWTEGGTATLSFVYPSDPAAAFAILLTAAAFVDPDRLPRQRVGLFVNDAHVADWLITENRPTTREIPLPRAEAGTGKVALRLDLPDATSPASLGLSADPRPLALLLIDLMLTRRPIR